MHHQERSKEYEKRKSWSHVEQRAALLEWYNVTGTAKTKVRCLLSTSCKTTHEVWFILDMSLRVFHSDYTAC